MKLFIVPLAAAAIALAASPALAKSKKKHRMYQHHYSQSFHPGWHGGGWHGGYAGPRAYWHGGYGGYGGGFVNRNVSDPSYVSPGYLRARALGRCVQDLGYGRYEYCGW